MRNKQTNNIIFQMGTFCEKSLTFDNDIVSFLKMSVVDIFLTSFCGCFCTLSIALEMVSLMTCFSSSLSFQILPDESVGGIPFLKAH